MAGIYIAYIYSTEEEEEEENDDYFPPGGIIPAQGDGTRGNVSCRREFSPARVEICMRIDGVCMCAYRDVVAGATDKYLSSAARPRGET